MSPQALAKRLALEAQARPQVDVVLLILKILRDLDILWYHNSQYTGYLGSCGFCGITVCLGFWIRLDGFGAQGFGMLAQNAQFQLLEMWRLGSHLCKLL